MQKTEAGRDEMIASIVERMRMLDMEELTSLKEALSAHRETHPKLHILPAAEADAVLDKVTIDDETQDWAESLLLGAGEIAAQLSVAPATLANWRRAGRVIAFRKGPRNFRYPVRQFDRFGPVAGLDQVLAHFATCEDAWEWLVTPNRYTASKAPIDRLKDRHLSEVARAAAGSLDFG